METRRTNKGGRPALADPAKHRHVLYLNARENARFLSQWEQSGVTSKSRFITARLFGEPFRVVKVDKSGQGFQGTFFLPFFASDFKIESKIERNIPIRKE